MKQSQLETGKTYSNGSKGKWYQERKILGIEGDIVSYQVAGGRDPGRKSTMTKAAFAAWAENEVG